MDTKELDTLIELTKTVYDTFKGNNGLISIASCGELRIHLRYEAFRDLFEHYNTKIFIGDDFEIYKEMDGVTFFAIEKPEDRNAENQ